MAGTMLGALRALSLVPPAIWEDNQYYTHLTDEKSDAWKVNVQL